MSNPEPKKIVASNEQWSEYLLEDGVVIRMKLNASNFLKDGNQYLFQGNATIEPIAPSPDIVELAKRAIIDQSLKKIE